MNALMAWMTTPQALASGCWVLGVAVVVQTLVWVSVEIAKLRRKARLATMAGTS